MASRNKLSRDRLELNDIKEEENQADLTEIYRTFHTNTKIYTFFSEGYVMFSQIDHILVHKAILNKY